MMNILTSFRFYGALALFSFNKVEGHGRGAPQQACISMFPEGHGVPAQNYISPYTVETNVKSKNGITGKDITSYRAMQ